MGPLCQEAQSWFRQCPDPVLVPLAGFLQPPGGPLLATLTGCHKGEYELRPREHERDCPASVSPTSVGARVRAGVSAAAWSLEEQLLLVGTQDGTVVVWDTEEWQTVHVLAGHTGEGLHGPDARPVPPGPRYVTVGLSPAHSPAPRVPVNASSLSVRGLSQLGAPPPP